MSGDSLGDRIKRYENAYSFTLTPRTPTIIRVDGRAFHTFMRGRQRPFDNEFVIAMMMATLDTAREMQGFKLAYTQSDEASFLLTDYDTLSTQPWFGGDYAKIVSISAALFTSAFNRRFGTRSAVFDARAFPMPLVDVPNYFVWRQRDWERNSVQMLAQAHFSHAELQGKKRADLHEMLHRKGINWATELSDQLKNGTFYTRDDRIIHDRLDYDVLDKLIQDELKREREF